MSSTPARGDKEGRPGEPSVQPSHSQQYSLSQQRQPHPPLPNHSLGVHGYHRSSLHQHQTLAGSSVPQGLQHPGYAHYPPQPPYPYSHPAVGVTMNTAYFQQPPWPQQGYPSSLSPPPSAGVNHPPVFNPQRPSTSASAPSSYAQHHPPPQQHSMSSPSSRNPPVAYPFANTSRSGSSTGGTAAKPKSSAPLNQNQIHAQTHPWRIKVYNACLACRKKKIKCDGQPTCNRCERLGYECSYVEVPHAPKDRDKSKSKTVTQTATSRTASQPSESPLEPITTHEIPTSHRTTPELHAIVPYTMSSQGQSKAGSGSLALSAVDNLRDINSRVDTRYASHPASARGDYPPIPTYKQSSESRASDQHLHTYQRNEYSTTSAEVFRSTNSVTRVIPSKKSSAFVLDHDASLPDLFHILTKAVAIAPPESKTSTSVPPSSSINNVQIGMDNLNIILITPVIPTITVMAPSSTDALYQLFGRLGQPSFRQSYVKDNDPSSAPPPDTAQQSSPNPSPQQIGHLVTNKNIIQYLVHVYFECFHPTWMIVDKKLFLAQLRDSHNPPDPLLLVAMCTAAAKYVDQEELCGEPGKMSTVGDQLLFHARILLQERFDIPSLPTVQALLILYWCQIHAGKASLRFMYIGMAIRMAQELELNRPLDAQEQLTIGEREVQIRKTIWWTCYQADRWTSAALGKPMVISDADCIVGYPTSLNSDEKPWIQHFRRLTELAKILGRIILNLYSATTANTCSSAVFSNLDQSLSNWYDSLPSALQYNIPSSSHPSVGYESLRIHRMGPSKTFTPPGGPKDLQSDIRMSSPANDTSSGNRSPSTTDSDRPSLSLSESASAAIKHDLYYLAVDLRIIQQFNRFAIEPSALRLLLEDFLPRSHLEEQELSWARAMIQQPIPTEPFSVTIPFPNLRSGQDTQSDHELSIQSSPPLHSQKTSVSIAAPTPSVTSSETKRSSHNKPNLRLTLPVTYFTAQQRNALKQQGSQSQVLPQTPTYAQEGQGGLVSRSQTPNASSTMSTSLSVGSSGLGEEFKLQERYQQYQLWILQQQKHQMMKQQQQQPEQQQRKQNQQDLEILQQQHQLQRAQLDQHHRQQTLILEQAQRSQQQQQQEQHEALMQQQQQLLFQQRRQSQQEQEQQSQVQEEHEQHKSQQRETRSAAESISTHSSLDRRNLSSDSGSMLNSRLSFGDTSPRTSPRQPGLQWGQKRRSLQSPHRSPQSRQFVQRQQQPDLHTHAQAQPQALFTAQAQAAANEFILEDTSLPAQ
ncbi:hypothetical protein BGW41_000045 [Actinomortierella wolfii]|nr:hypothetical protein BGW41_000045 [Actinomortierella wolfii]